MITVKERTDYKELLIDKFSIYNMKSQNKKTFDSPSLPSKNTTQSQYQKSIYSMNDILDFVNSNLDKYKVTFHIELTIIFGVFVFNIISYY